MVRFIGGKLSDTYGRILILKFSTLCLAISMIIIGFATNTTAYLTGAFLFGIGYGLNSPTLFAWAIDLSPEKNIGRGISTLFIFLELGIGTGSLISGSLYQGINSRLPSLFVISAFFSFIAFLFVLSKKMNLKPLKRINYLTGLIGVLCSTTEEYEILLSLDYAYFSINSINGNIE